MADYEDTRRRIISSVFTRRNASNNTDENYIAHLRISEIEGGVDKLRYIILSGAFMVPCVVNNAVLLTLLQNALPPFLAVIPRTVSCILAGWAQRMYRWSSIIQSFATLAYAIDTSFCCVSWIKLFTCLHIYVLVAAPVSVWGTFFMYQIQRLLFSFLEEDLDGCGAAISTTTRL